MYTLYTVDEESSVHRSRKWSLNVDKTTYGMIVLISNLQWPTIACYLGTRKSIDFLPQSDVVFSV